MVKSIIIKVAVLFLVTGLGLYNINLFAAQNNENKTSIFDVSETKSTPSELSGVLYNDTKRGIQVYWDEQDKQYFAKTPITQFLLKGSKLPSDAKIIKVQSKIGNILLPRDLNTNLLTSLFELNRNPRINTIIGKYLSMILGWKLQLVVTYQSSQVVINQPPIISSTPPDNVISGNMYRYQLVVKDPENDNLTYRLINPIGSMTIDSAGLFTWQTQSSDKGTFNIDIEVSDGGNIVNQRFQIVVSPPTAIIGTPGNFSTVTPITASVDNPLRPTFSWTQSLDSEGAAITYTLYLGAGGQIGVAPTPVPIIGGLTRTSYTINFDLQYNTPYVWYVIASNGTNSTQSNSSKFNTMKRPNSAPVVNAGGDQVVISGNVVTLDGSASYDPDGDTLSYIWAMTDGPASVVLSSPNTPVTTFVAPQVDAPTVLRFTLWATDTQTQSTDEVLITVNPQ